MPFWESIFKGGAEGLLTPIAKIVDDVVTNKEEKIKVETELKRVIFEHEALIQAEWTKREQAMLNDVASARAMNMKALDSVDKFVRRFPYYLAAGVLLATFILYAIIISGQYPASNKEIVYALTGSLTTISMMVLGFFFGTTMSSTSKNETIKNLTNGNRE